VTIAISVKINDGVVLATDSASTVTGAMPQGMAVFNIYDNANKAFNLLKGLPIGAVTRVTGGIGNASITTLVKDLWRRFKGGPKRSASGMEVGQEYVHDRASRHQTSDVHLRR
jgi:hypothetical protein